MRLIDADALKEIYSGNGTFTAAHFRTAIDEQPTVDAIPVRRGRWIGKKVADDIKLPQMQEAKCSVCGRYLSTPYMYYWTKYNYCPNCGADMREE